MIKKTLILLSLVLIIISCNNQEKNLLKSINPENKITTTKENDSTIINSYGYRIKTGVVIPLDSFKGENIHSIPTIVKLKKPITRTLKSRNTKISEEPNSIFINYSELNTFQPGTDTSTFVMTNSEGRAVLTGKPIPAKGSVRLLIQPQPTETQPAQKKDIAGINNWYFDIEQGLHSSYIVSLLEDSRGNIWLGSKDGGGATLYDGESFFHYGAKEGLSNSGIRCIIEDRKGNIWFGSEEDGLFVFNGENFKQFTEKNGLTINSILTLFEDSKGNIWVGTNSGGVTKFNGETFTHYTKKEGVSNIIRGIAEDNDGNIWFSSYTEGVFKFDGKIFTQFTEENGLGDNSVMPILNDKNGHLWFGTWGAGLIKYDGVKFTHFTEKDGLCYNNINTLAEDNKGNIWIGTWEGLSKYDGLQFTNYTEEDGITNNDINAICIDQFGNLWLGTWGGGLNIYNPSSFINYTEKSGLSDDHVFSAVKDHSGNLWFTSWNGLTYFNGSELNHFTTEQGLPRAQAFSVFEDSNGIIWSGNELGGLYGLQNETLTYYTEIEKLNNKIKSIKEDKEGNLWLAYERSGLCKFNNQTFTVYDEKSGFPKNEVNTIVIDKNETLWIGTEGGGLIKISGQNFICFSTKEGLCDNRITTIFEDNDGKLWIGTRDGLNLFDGTSFFNIGINEGLSNNSIRSIIQDRQNNLWIGTEKGLNLIPGKFFTAGLQGIEPNISRQLKILQFGISDGLRSTEFYPNSVCIENNNIWFGTSKGLACLNLNQFHLPEIKPKIKLNRIEVNEQFIDFRNSPNYKKLKFQKVIPFFNYPISLKLPAKKNHLSFHFAAMDSDPVYKVKYSYKINELNNEWSIPSVENKADYRTLPNGNYTFMVKAIGKSNIWSDPIIYRFTISPPWWNSVWARIFYTVITICIIIGVIHWRTNHLNKKQALLKQQIEERNRQIEKATESDRLKSAFLATMSHEIRTPLNAIIGFSELITKNTPVDEIIGFSKIINSSGAHLLRIVEDIFDISLIESGQIKLNIENVNMRIVFESVFNIIREEKKRVGKENIEINLVYPENKNVLIESDLSKLKQILINLLKNALKYSDKGSIKFGYFTEKHEEKPCVKCFVKDTGIGIPTDKKEIIFEIFRQVDDSNTREYGGVGIGLSISKRLTELLGGKIWVESKIEKGSTFFFTLPLNTKLKSIEDKTEIKEKSNSLEGKVILIAEDDKISYDFLKIILSQYGIKTIKAKDGKEAVEICKTESVDLILMDLNMPEMNGYTATREIKKFKPDLPVIAQTAYAIKGDLQKALEAGCNDYISKPIKKDLLISKIKKSFNIQN